VGLDLDLDLGYDGMEMAVVNFYIAYICCQWIGTAWNFVPAHIFVGVMAISWGTVASVQSVAISETQLLYLRSALGFVAAAVNSLPLYLSLFYKREELGGRIGILFAATPLSTSVASFLSLAITGVGQTLSIVSWRLLFLLEGIPSVLLGLWGWSRLPDRPDRAPFLTKLEQQIAQRRVLGTRLPKTDSMGNLQSKLYDGVMTLLDPKNYVLAIMFFAANLTFTAMPSFMTTKGSMSFAAIPIFFRVIAKNLGFSSIGTHLLCAPPYLASGFIVIFVMWRSDGSKQRSYFICVLSILSATGYAILALGGLHRWNAWWLYLAIYPAALGNSSILALIVTWTIDNQESLFRRTISFAMIQLVGQVAPGFAVRAFPETDQPYYTKAMITCMFSMLTVAVLAVLLRFWLARKNAGRKETLQFQGEGSSQYLDEQDSASPKLFML
jgi:MFS family permease